MTKNNQQLNLIISLALIVAVGLGCMGMRKPWRDYSEKPFSSKEWIAGDRVERGRMYIDLAKKRLPNGKTPEGVLEMLGEPDLKKTIEGKEVWFYRIDFGIVGAMDLVPVSFDKGRASYGMARGSTYSILAKEEDL